MSSAQELLAATLLIYMVVGVLGCLGLNLQYGEAGILSFAFILFEAIGAYTAAVFALPSPGSHPFQTYILGLHVQFPLPWLAGMAAAGILGVLLGSIGGTRVRRDYEAVIMLVISLVALDVVNSATGLFNGSLGLTLVPPAMSGSLTVTQAGLGYAWMYVGICAGVCLVVVFGVWRLSDGPYGLALRALRESEDVAMSLGYNTRLLRASAMGIGGAIGGLAGGMLVQYIGAWSPSAWGVPETFGLFAAVVIGGRGRVSGQVLGGVVVAGIITEGVIFLPPIGPSYLIGALQWIVVGGLLMVCLWFRPEGLVPAPRRSYRFLVPSVITGGRAPLPPETL